MTRDRGFALLIVLLALGFLALLGVQIVSSGRNVTLASQQLGQAARLEAAAQGAIAHAAFGAMVSGDPTFRPNAPPRWIEVAGVPVLVRIRNESDYVNLNTTSVVLLQALIAEVGAPPAAAARIAAATLDWRTQGQRARANGAKAPEYRAANLPYAPPEAPFQSVDEFRYVLGMTPDLFARLAPHLTVWTDSDPDLTTQDPVVAQAIVDAASTPQDVSVVPDEQTETVLRITASAAGRDGNRQIIREVVTGDFRQRPPKLRTLFYEHCIAAEAALLFGSCN